MYLIFLAILFLINKTVSGVNFETNKVITISLNDSERVADSYFGYSLLLQKGPSPVVIVGAPKQSKETGGAVFSCDILNDLGCTKYNVITNNLGTFNGNFLGVVVDGNENTGHPFITCAPRKVTTHGSGANIKYFLKGSCFYHRNSSRINETNIEFTPLKYEAPIGNVKGQYYYDYGFGQAGIDAVYDELSQSVILGGIGIKNWNGAVVKQSLKLLTTHQIIPKRDAPVISESYDYLGYKVCNGAIKEMSVIIAGAPRAENLAGKVKLYNDYGLYRSFKGDEIGSFFGSALLSEDVNNDDIDDLFIGAPTAAGSSFDEGSVYFYKNSLTSSIKLTGRKQKGARFGSNIVALGDIDLDSFNDVAISAPYEDNGIGAVYIFMGSSDGIKTTFSQRLSPLLFPGNHLNVRGFGMGLSKGNDIDGNGHNDLAIGAYKSGHVVVVRTKSVIDFRTALESNVTSIKSNNYQMTIRYCVFYEPRSSLQFFNSVNFHMKLMLDYRVKGPKIHSEFLTVAPKRTKCSQTDVQIEQSIVDLMPFNFVLRTDVIQDVFGEGTTTIERSIPYAHGCGIDNICQTQILLNAITDSDNIILGLDKVIDVKITAENIGEPGYQCQLLIQIPKELELRQERMCTFENSTYSCPFTTKLDTDQEKEIKVNFDVLKIKMGVKALEISFEMRCLGENNENKETLRIGVLFRNSPYIEGKSEPENYEFNEENAAEETEIELHHTFTLGNFGPSPVKSDVYIIFPVFKIGDTDLFQFIEAAESLRGIRVPCYNTNETKVYEKTYDVSSVVKASLSRTVVMDCYEQNSNCLELSCKGDYLYKSSENAKVTIKFKIKNGLLVNFFQKQDQSKNILAYISSAYLLNGSRIDGHAATLILSSHATHVPLWIYIVASLLGIVLLGLLIFVFYKCHFFDRRYRDKMNEELLMENNTEMDDELPKVFQEETKSQSEATQ